MDRRNFLKVLGGAAGAFGMRDSVEAQSPDMVWEKKKAIFQAQIEQIKKNEQKLAELCGADFVRRLNISNRLEKLINDPLRDPEQKRALLETDDIGNIPFAPLVEEKPSLIQNLKTDGTEVESKIPWEDLHEIFKTMPKGWVYGKVKSITHTLRAKNADTEKEFDDKDYLLNFHQGVHYPDHSLEFHPTNKEMPHNLLRILYHEIGHADDPENCDQLTGNQKIQLWLKLLERSLAQDRLDTERMLVLDSQFNTLPEKYESLRTAKRDYSKLTPEQRLRFAKEYYAELCAEAFYRNGVENPEDWEIVKTVIQQTDPDYKWKENAQKRREIELKIDDKLFKIPKNSPK